MDAHRGQSVAESATKTNDMAQGSSGTESKGSRPSASLKRKHTPQKAGYSANPTLDFAVPIVDTHGDDDPSTSVSEAQKDLPEPEAEYSHSQAHDRDDYHQSIARLRNAGFKDKEFQTRHILGVGKMFLAIDQARIAPGEENEDADDEFIVVDGKLVLEKVRPHIGIKDCGDEWMCLRGFSRGKRGLEGLPLGSKRRELFVRLVDWADRYRRNFKGGIGVHQPLVLKTGQAGEESLLKLQIVFVKKTDLVKSLPSTLEPDSLLRLLKLVRDKTSFDDEIEQASIAAQSRREGLQRQRLSEGFLPNQYYLPDSPAPYSTSEDDDLIYHRSHQRRHSESGRGRHPRETHDLDRSRSQNRRFDPVVEPVAPRFRARSVRSRSPERFDRRQYRARSPLRSGGRSSFDSDTQPSASDRRRRDESRKRGRSPTDTNRFGERDGTAQSTNMLSRTASQREIRPTHSSGSQDRQPPVSQPNTSKRRPRKPRSTFPSTGVNNTPVDSKRRVNNGGATNYAGTLHHQAPAPAAVQVNQQGGTVSRLGEAVGKAKLNASVRGDVNSPQGNGNGTAGERH